MKKIINVLIIGILAVAAVSCNPNKDSFASTYSDFGCFNSAGNFVTDGGDAINFNADQTDKGWTTDCRYYIEYFYSKESGEDPVITLLSYVSVTTKSAIYKSSASEEDYGSDPVWVRYYSISGTEESAYINLVVYFYYLEGSDTQHKLDLLLDDTVDVVTSVNATMQHDAAGEYYGSSSVDNSKLDIAYGFVSFPMSDIDKLSTSTINLMKLTYSWHELVGNEYTGDVEEKTISLSLR